MMSATNTPTASPEGAIAAYLRARWAEPETKMAVTTIVGVTLAWCLGALGIITPPTVSLHVMETTDVGAAITALLPGPISSSILRQVFGSDTPASGALPAHQSRMAAVLKRPRNGN